MKTIGLLGGMSWKSSLDYYRMINEIVHDKLGGWNSAKIIMYSVNFNEIDIEHQTPDWIASDKILINVVKSLEKAGADFIVICCNTAHALYDELQKNVKIPILHIADATAEKIKEKQIKRIGFLGTKHTIDQDFYKGRLEKKHRFEIIMPTNEEKEVLNSGINKMIKEGPDKDLKKKFIEIINNLEKKGAEAVILGCTELPLIVSQKDVNILLFDTARIHAESAVEYAGY